MKAEAIKVLLIEDNPLDAQIVRAILIALEEEFQFAWAETLKAGLDHLARFDYDIVLLDFGLPDSDGLSTFDEVLRRAPHVAIVPLTASGDDQIAVQAVRAGAQDYLFKGSVSRPLLVRTIRYAVERKRAEETLRRAHDELERRVEERTLELKRLYEAEREARLLAETLQAANLALTRSLDLDEVLNALLDRLCELVPYDSASVMLCADEDRLTIRLARGYQTSTPVAGIDFDLTQYPHLREVVQSRQSRMLCDTEAEPGWRSEIGGGAYVRNWLGVPLIARDRVIGLYSLDKREPGYFTEEHRKRAESLTVQAAVAIENARLFAAVRAAEEQLRALSHRLVEVQEGERLHLARELHDEIGQQLTGLKLQLEMIARARPPADLADAQSLVNDLMARVRALSLDLRPPMLDDLGLLHALLWHFERFTHQTGIAVTFTQRGLEDRRFAPEIETAAYRLVQEALTNVARYAGVKEATVHVWASPDLLHLQIEDLGRGFDPQQVRAAGTTSGLAGMRERATLLGGRLAIDSDCGSGTIIAADLPLGEQP
jgi:signal transduction histidine kinase